MNQQLFQLCQGAFVILLAREVACSNEGFPRGLTLAEREFAFAQQNLHNHPIRFLREGGLQLLSRLREPACIEQRLAEAETRQLILRVLHHPFGVPVNQLAHTPQYRAGPARRKPSGSAVRRTACLQGAAISVGFARNPIHCMPLFALADAAALWPFATLAVCVAVIVILITKLRVHAFLALIAAAFLAGFLTREFPPAQINRLPAALREDAQANSWVAAVELTAIEFGGAAGTIAISIGLASIIGLGLMESGAADKVVRRFLAVFGEKRAGFALLASTYVLSIPIFFDTMFMLMIPLARALRLRTGRDYVLYMMCICVGGVLTHSLTVPHPGPLGMVDNLRVDPGFSLLWGLTAGLVPCVAGYFVAVWINRWTEVPLRETPGAPLSDLHGISARPENQLPSFFWSILPVILPIGLISLASFCKLAKGWPAFVNLVGGPDPFQALFRVASFIGNKNIALLLGTVIALWVLARQRGYTFARIGDLLGPPLETAGVIIIITAAGGAFGAMLKNAGVGDAIKAVSQGHDVSFLLLAFVVALTIRFAQGSATVAMLTTSSMMYEVIQGVELPYHMMYLFLSIGFGAFSISWMNDSGFWVVSRLGGMTERETLRTWTLTLFATAVFGFLQVLLLSVVLPLK